MTVEPNKRSNSSNGSFLGFEQDTSLQEVIVSYCLDNSIESTALMSVFDFLFTEVERTFNTNEQEFYEGK